MMQAFVTFQERLLGNDAVAFTTTTASGRDPRVLCPVLGVDEDRFYRPHQVHLTDIKVLREETFLLPSSMRGADENVCEKFREMEAYDAVIYDVKNACVGISTADCIPVLAYDPRHKAAAAIHAGWRGTVERIVEKTIAKMKEVYATEPSELICAIGPGISLESFEVGDEVYEAFAKAGFPMKEMSARYPSSDGIEGHEKWHLDIKRCNAIQLIASGVKEENIHLSPIDTMTDTRFFSARRDGTKTGRILSGVVLRPTP